MDRELCSSFLNAMTNLCTPASIRGRGGHRLARGAGASAALWPVNIGVPSLRENQEESGSDSLKSSVPGSPTRMTRIGS